MSHASNKGDHLKSDKAQSAIGFVSGLVVVSATVLLARLTPSSDLGDAANGLGFVLMLGFPIALAPALLKIIIVVSGFFKGTAYQALKSVANCLVGGAAVYAAANTIFVFMVPRAPDLPGPITTLGAMSGAYVMGMIILAGFVGRLARETPDVYLFTRYSAGRRVVRWVSDAAVPAGRRISDIQRRVIATHEAGHVLMYAAVFPRPPDLRAVVKKKVNEGEYGNVSAVVHDGDYASKPGSVEWRQWQFLAGSVCEARFAPFCMRGSSRDNRYWLDETPCRDDPDKALALYIEQAKKVEAFIEANAAVMTKIRDQLLGKSELLIDDLEPLLDQVQLTGDIPVINQDTR